MSIAVTRGLRTVRPAHQITMAGDKVLSGDCRFARRNYFPDARKEIAARVTMARSLRRRYFAMETRNEFLHGTFLPPPPPSFSPRLLPPSGFAGVLLSRRFSPPSPLPLPSPLRSDSSSVPFRDEAVFGLFLSVNLGASFNEKLISRVSRLSTRGAGSSFSSYCSPVLDFAVSLFSLLFSFFAFFSSNAPVSSSVKNAWFASCPFSTSFLSGSPLFTAVSRRFLLAFFTADASYARLHPPLFW